MLPLAILIISFPPNFTDHLPICLSRHDFLPSQFPARIPLSETHQDITLIQITSLTGGFISPSHHPSHLVRQIAYILE